MCGIAGYFLPDRPASEALVRRMCAEIVHRGPDDEGVLAVDGCGIGMRRLSIIDLSTGHQPIPNEDETVWIVFNGEVYNYQELRPALEAHGHRFRTQSDTETLLHSYEQNGPESLASFRGMFAYAIWDGRRRQLMLARDRFGKKPLYYSLQPEGIYFGSELKCLRAAGIPLDLDEEALRLYFQFSYIPDPHSPFRQVKKLPPGGWLIYDANGQVRQGRYWHLPAPAAEAAPGFTEAQAREQIRDVFDEAVRLRMIADVPLGAFLSGGVDSSSVVASMARQSSQPVKTFSIYFDQAEYDESSYAAMIARRYATDHRTLKVEPDSVSLVPKLVDHFDEPFGDSSAIPTYLVSQFAVQHVKVALSGDGGDEIFAGYDSFFQAAGQNRWSALPGPARRLLAAVAERLPYEARGKNFLRMISRGSALERYFENTYTPHFLNENLFTPPWRMPMEEALLRRTFADCLLPPEADILLQSFYFEATAKLTGDMLVKVDRMSMAASLEVRCPLLDHILAELAFRLPPAWKMKNGQGKAIFIEAMGDRLPPEIWQRPKRGFSVPIADWFRGPLRPMLFDTLRGPRFLERGFVSPAFLAQLMDEHDRGRRNNRYWLWNLLILELWLRKWRDGAPARP